MNRSEGDSYRPRYGTDLGPPPPLPAGAQDAMYHFHGNGNEAGRSDGRRRNAPNRPPRSFRFRAPPPSERPLFTQSHLEESSELTFGGNGAEDKFRNPNELTDTDEADMDVSADDDYGDREQIENRPSKRTRINEQGTAAGSLHKWSNPDPYTALPPVDQDSRKKTNVVNLIRRARNTATTGQKDDLAAHEDDFISFDFDEEEEANTSIAPSNAPLGPRLGRHEVVPSTLGKRTRDDFENAPLVTPKFGQQYHSDGRVLQIWRADADCDPTPWLKNNASLTDSAGVALHKEIIDFYDWVQPRDYEAAVRSSVLERLEQALLRVNPGGSLQAFGSYAAGLYLPVGDMDLVFLERTFRPRATTTGPPPKPSRNVFERTAKFIREKHIARPGSVVAIWFAKVPIIKFVENISGLKVDLSFNNTTGVTANQTFHSWREQYPAMPIITSIIKQFLMIRGLNDVASGGLGGFSVICLVTSLIQHMPVTSQPANLGQTLVEFFNLYGKLFNRQQVAIRLDPPGYLDAASYRPFQFNNDKPDRLKIIDPNRPENNISGGTNKIGLIFDCFATAHDLLQERLAAHANGGGRSSFLEHVVGGNFEAYDTQREYLQELHLGPSGLKAPAVLPPPPPPPTNRRDNSFTPPPPPPPPTYQAQVPVRTRSSVSSNDSRPGPQSLGNGQTQDNKNDTPSIEVSQTIQRLELLRPELTGRAEHATNMQELARIGGYGRVHVMLKDLEARDGVSTMPKSHAPARIPSDHSHVSIPAEAAVTQNVLEWNRARVRRFRPDLSAVIDSCTSKSDMASAGGYDGPSQLFSALGDWEKQNGLHESVKQQKAAFGPTAERAPLEQKINPKGLNPKKKKSRNKRN